MKKEGEVIMLPTKDRSSIIVNTYINKTHSIKPLLSIKASKKYLDSIMSHDDTSSLTSRGLQPQHLYITTDDEIKEGDWCIITNKTGTQFIARNNGSNYELSTGGFVDISATSFKIIATTDKSLLIGKITKTENANIGNYKTLLQPSQEFIEEYCKEGGIDKVLVEYVIDQKTIDYSSQRLIPKVDSDNTIKIVTLEEKMYSKEDVEHILYTYAEEQHSWFTSKSEIESFNNWIKENL